MLRSDDQAEDYTNTLLSDLITERNSLKFENQKCVTELETTKESNKELIIKYNKWVQVKEDSEELLYIKFRELLNRKKRKIKQLEVALKSIQQFWAPLILIYKLHIDVEDKYQALSSSNTQLRIQNESLVLPKKKTATKKQETSSEEEEENSFRQKEKVAKSISAKRVLESDDETDTNQRSDDESESDAPDLFGIDEVTLPKPAARKKAKQMKI